jgi:hypothetical protein
VLIGGLCVLIGGRSMLVGTVGALGSRADAIGRLVIELLDLVTGVFNLLPVVVCLLANLIYFGLDWRGGVPNILLRGTTAGEQSADQEACGR